MADLLFTVEDHLARITLNRPEVLNAFTDEMIRDWVKALEEVRDNDDIYAVLVAGNGRAFCAGGDVKLMAAGKGFYQSDDDISSTALARKNSLWKRIHRVALTLDQIDKPVVCKLQGPATGAGLDMALMCDIRIAAKSAKLGETYLNAGIVPGDGGTYFLPKLARPDQALDLFWTAKIIRGEEAEKLGLVTFAVDDDQLDEFTENYMKKLISGPQEVMRFTKRNVKAGRSMELSAALDMISSAMGIVTELPDYHDRVSALVARMKK